MKAKIIISVLTALVMSACSSSYMAKSGNDDLYYTPRSGGSAQQSQTETAKVSETKNSPSSEKRSPAQMTDYEKYRASMDNKELADTTGGGQNYADNTEVQNAADSKEPVVKSDEYYGEGGDSYIYNNYYYTSRLNRFHGGFYDPYFYDSFYFDTWCNPWYSSGWNFSIGWGWGYGYPYYSDYYYPYYGGYWGYYGYNPYYYGHHNYYGYYDGYGYSRWGGNYYSDRTYGRIPNRSNLTNTAYGRNRSNTTGFYSGSREKSTRINANAGTSRGGYTSSGRRYTNDNFSTRGTNERSIYTRRAPVESNGTVVNGRRYDNSGNSSRGRTDYNNGSSRNSGNERTYTPYYSQPRNSSRAPYNGSSSSNTYSGSRGSSSSSSGYSRPSSSSSSSGYSSSRRETNNESSSSRSYTPPSNNSSSGSYSSGSSSGRGSSGGGGSTSSSSSGGGRRR